MDIEEDAWARWPLLAHYRIGPPLGEGASGDVFGAFDTHRRRWVALKKLKKPHAESLSRLKREFRRASALRHPNLVRMYELLAVDGQWFFTMERVDGRSIAAGATPRTWDDGAERPPPTRDAASAFDGPTALHRAFGQLARALVAVHDAGLLHLDIHPGNVLVDRGGRVVLLDFGMVASVGDAHVRGGAPGFRAPELADGTAQPTSDWYSFGALLEMSIGALAPSAERDGLAGLAQRLRAPQPEARCGGEEVLAWFDQGVTRPMPSGSRTVTEPFSGRARELQRLSAAAASAARGRMVVGHLRGVGGIGKSRLVDELLAGVGASLVLRGRCRASESVPLGGLDEVVEALAAVPNEPAWAALSAGERTAIQSMFPVLGGDTRADVPLDWLEAQHAGIAGLAKVLAASAARRPLVVVLEDLHHAGTDTLRALSALLAVPMPGLFVLLTERTGGMGDAMVSAHDATAMGRDFVEVDLGPLSVEEALELLVGDARDSTARRELVAQSAGQPLVLGELRHHPGCNSLEELVATKVAALQPRTRRLVQAVALAGGLPRNVALEVAGLNEPGGTGVESALDLLERDHLVRCDGVAAAARVEPFHDAIAEIIVGTIGAARTPLHLAIARSFESVASGAGARALHLDLAGSSEAAVESALAAADSARGAFALDRVVVFLQIAARGTVGGPLEADTQRALAEALVAAGRAAEGAACYSQLAQLLPDGAGRRGVESLATGHLLAAGRITEGTERLRGVGASVGVAWPRSAPVAALWSIPRLIRLWWRGVAPAPSDVPTQARACERVDLALVAARGLLAVDSIRGAYYALCALESARTCGDSARLASSLLVVGAGVLGALDGPLGRWGRGMIESATRLSAEVARPRLSGFVAIGHSQERIYRGDWGEAVRHGEAGLSILRTHCDGVAWETSMGMMGVIRGLEELGDLEGARARADELASLATRRGDGYGVTTAHLYGAFHELQAGNLERAEERARIAMASWEADRYTVQHFYADRVKVYVALYRAALSPAGERTDLLDVARASAVACLGELRRAGLHTVPILGIDAALMEGRVALARAASTGAGWREASAAARRLRTFSRPDAGPHAAAIEGAVAHGRGDGERAEARWLEAETGFAGYRMFLARAMVQMGRRSTSDGEREAACEFVRAQGIADPDSWLFLMLGVRRGGASDEG